MSENWTAIAGEVASAIAEVGFAATLTRPGARTGPEYDPTFAPPTAFPVTVIDDQIRVRDQSGTTTRERMRVLTIGATGVVPAMGDSVTVRGVTHAILSIMPLAPGGVDLLYEIEIEA